MEKQQQQSTPGAGVDLALMPDEGWIYVQNQDLEKLDGSGSTESLTIDLAGEQKPVIVLTVRGAKSGQPRRIPLMRVEHNGSYAAVASRGGSAKTPAWFYNLKMNPDVELQDSNTIGHFTARELVGDERALWWDRAVKAFQPYADYAKRPAD